MPRNTVNLTLPAIANDMKLLLEGPPMHACWFSCVFKMMTPCLITQQDLQHMHHLQYSISTNDPYNNQQGTHLVRVECVCVRAHVPTWYRMGTQPVIIKITYNSMLHCYSS
jgi:hypothetical protein